jgi:hypothetical protein
MAPPPKKWAASKTPPSNSKRLAIASNSKGHGKSKSLSVATLLLLGFSSVKRPTFHIGTKVLLDTSIYPKGKVPPSVDGHLFVYKIVAIEDNGKTTAVVNKNQVVQVGGDLFHVYKDSDDPQVCCRAPFFF